MIQIIFLFYLKLSSLFHSSENLKFCSFKDTFILNILEVFVYYLDV